MDYKITDLFEELQNDPSWCEDPEERKKKIAGLKALLRNTF